MTIGVVLIGLLPALLVAAATFDLTRFLIPNEISIAILALFVVFLTVVALSGHAMAWTDVALHFFTGFLGLAIGMALFTPGWIGGGDAKLFAVVALWLGWDALYHYVMLVFLLGGVLTVGLIAFRRLPLPSVLSDLPWIARLADEKAGIPYGVALAIAAVIVLPDTEIFHFAAIG